MPKENILFSQQMITVLLEHVRLFEKVLRNHFDLTLTQFSVLHILEEHDGGLTINQIEEHFPLKRRTILSALLDLENSDLVSKQDCAKDHRVMLINTTLKSKPLVSDASNSIYRILKETFWHNIPNKELSMLNQMRYSDQSLHDIPHEKDIDNNWQKINTDLATSFCISIKTITGQWENLADNLEGLSLNAYRVLALLESYGGLSPSEIASSLLLANSRVSTAKDELLAKQLIKVIPHHEDSRSKILQATRTGLRAAKKMNSEMGELTRQIYMPLHNEEKKILNAWHLRMYLELDTVHRIIDTLQ